MFDRLEMGHQLTTLVPIEDVDVRRRPAEWLAGDRLAMIDDSAAPGNWQFRFQNGCRLNVGSWRIISAGAVALSSEDHGQQFGLPRPEDLREGILKVVGSKPVSSVEIGADTGDIRIEFGGSVRFEGLVTSRGHESWDLWGIDGTQVVATGGGRIHRAGSERKPQ